LRTNGIEHSYKREVYETFQHIHLNG